jgi:hypothetical protein
MGKLRYHRILDRVLQWFTCLHADVSRSLTGSFKTKETYKKMKAGISGLYSAFNSLVRPKEVPRLL